jgi:hypothetical protein
VNACYGLPGPSGSLSISQNPVYVNQSLTLTANASGPNNDLNRVEFYVDNQLVHTDFNAPFQHNLSFSTAGTYSLHIWIYDDCGAAIKPGASTLTVNNNPNCNLPIHTEDFENGWGIWIDGGADAYLKQGGVQPNSGSLCAAIQDNTNASTITTIPLNLTTFTGITVAFSYYPVSMDNSNEDFWLQISTDGGQNYTTVEEWNQGDEFQNNQRYNDQVILSGPFTADTRIRFRCEASGNGDDVYIDDIALSGCSWGAEVCRVFGDADGDGICDPFDLCPNLDDSLIGSSCDDGDANTSSDVWTSNCSCEGTAAGCGIVIDGEDFEAGFGDWNDGGADCIRRNNTNFANSGSFSINLQDDGPQATMTTDLYDLTAYNEVTVTFSYYCVSMDNGNEDFWLQYSLDGGATFTTLQQWAQGTDFFNNQRYNEQVVIPGPFTASTKFRFRCDASGNGDDVYIDDVLITGCQGTTFQFGIMGQPIVDQQDTTSAPESIEISANIIQLYPNPFSSKLTIGLERAHGYSKVTLMNMRGQLIETKAIDEDALRIDWELAQLLPGMYTLHFSGKGESQVKRVIKMKN